MKPLLQSHGFHFSKAKGQNFLISRWVPEQIAEDAGVDAIIEGDKKLKERVTDAAGMIMKMPQSQQSGSIYIDRVTFSNKKLHDQITPDQQIPQNNWNLERDMWQWCRLWEWEQYPAFKSTKVVSDAEIAILKTVSDRIDDWATTGNPGKEYTANTLMGRVDGYFEKYGIRRLPDGSVTGAPLMSDDEFNHGLGEMRIKFIQEIVYWCALDYMYTGNTRNVPRVVDALDHALDHGFAYGSGWGTNHQSLKVFLCNLLFLLPY